MAVGKFGLIREVLLKAGYAFVTFEEEADAQVILSDREIIVVYGIIWHN